MQLICFICFNKFLLVVKFFLHFEHSNNCLKQSGETIKCFALL